MSCLFSGVYLCSETKRPLRYPLVGHRSIHQQCARDPSHNQWRRPARFRVTSHISVPVSKQTDNDKKNSVKKERTRTFDWDLYVYIHIHTYIIYICRKLFAEFCCFSSWSQLFSGNGFCWLARGSSQEQGMASQRYHILSWPNQTSSTTSTDRVSVWWYTSFKMFFRFCSDSSESSSYLITNWFSSETYIQFLKKPWLQHLLHHLDFSSISTNQTATKTSPKQV